MSLERSLDSIINSEKVFDNTGESSFFFCFNSPYRRLEIRDYQDGNQNDYFLKRIGLICILRHVFFLRFLGPIDLYKRNYNEPWTHDLYEGSGEKSSIGVSKQAYKQVPKPLSYRVKVENLHYELTEDDLNGLFKRIGPVSKLNIKYDRSGRSTGIAFVSFERIEDAHNAINQFNGANAAGQPITLTLDLQPSRKSQRKSDSLFGRISNFKVDPYRRKLFNNYRSYRRLEGEYKTQEDLDNELDKYMNVAIQSSNDTEKPMVIDEK
ncbi:hypothetical protein PNEG_03208 [Pneumocystis murina B123]|uniref:RRM domain-containing protein n=1 Tax=Pneumocystis murina (strain B123) TaxID=1069680 RepID=M7NIG8_PNEMU|nr:hypothetical protein PNEG_03208 [Pneumocystis murina B123]EMR08368.1 hypothetical protein PNEG_03208 [Pneumocystis murina B123]